MTFFPHSRLRLTAPKPTKHGRFFTRVVITYLLHGRTRTFTAYPVA